MNSHRRRLLAGALLIASAWAAIALLPGQSAAQRSGTSSSGSDTGRALVDDLLRSLIESELEKRNVLPNRGGTNPRSPSSVSPTPRVVDRPTREMLEARRVLAEVSREADRLTSQLNADLTRVPGIRPYMGDVLRLRARASLLAQRSNQLNDHRELIEDLKTLDSDWRVLEYRLKSLRGLSTPAMQSIERLNGYATALSGSFNMAPQLDQHALLQKIAILTSDLHNLIDDIDIELNPSNERTQLLLDGRRLEQETLHVADLVSEGAGHETIVTNYKRFQTNWNGYVSRLRGLNNRYIERDVQRIREVEAEIHALLWLPQDYDRHQLLHLAGLLKKSVDDFYARAPMKLLMELPENDRVLPVADQFYGVCENFIGRVETGAEPLQLVEEFRYVESAWQEFHLLLKPLKSRTALDVLAQIDQNMKALATALQIRDSYNHQGVLELAASIDSLAQHLQGDIGRWLSYSPTSFRNEALRDTADFAALAHQFHVDVLNGASQSEITRNANHLHESWRKAHQWVLRCNTEDRIHLQRVSSRITPVLVDLRTMVQ
ncbi:MAG: hypothetical protein KY476_07720 [Planctomycetes bacterium]|nr:hypothetical protein [Planctomycetota bacterium]